MEYTATKLTPADGYMGKLTQLRLMIMTASKIMRNQSFRKRFNKTTGISSL